MLSLYRRHRAACPHAGDRISKKCHCTIWATGTLDAKPYRKSLKTRSFVRATQIIRDIENGKQEARSITLSAALQAFIAECESRNLNSTTLAKYRRLAASLRSFAGRERIETLSDCTVESLRSFRNSWKLTPRTASKQIERLRAFFGFTIENGWIGSNPAKAIKAPEINPNPTLPFTNEEVSKILAAADFRTRTFYRLLLHSGLRIIDAAQARPEKIINGKMFLYTQKTGVPVMCPLPPDLLEDIENLTTVGGLYFAVESEKPVTIAEYYRVKLKQAGKKTGVLNARPHRFRDTFAVRLLEKGVPIDTVSILLGHTDIKTTQRSYAPWVKSLQDNLESAVAKTWERPKLARVK